MQVSTVNQILEYGLKGLARLTRSPGPFALMVLGWFVLFTSQFSVNAAPSGQKLTLAQLNQAWPSYNSSQKFNIIEQLLRSGRFDLAQEFLNKFHPKTQAGQMKQRFLQGLLYGYQGQHEKAVEVYRSLLKDRPDLVRVRLELARSLFVLKEDQSAKHHFELVQGASGLDGRSGKLVQNYIDAMNRRKRWSFSPYITLAPSSNINRGSREKVIMINGLPFTIDDGAQETSGLGVTAGASAGYRFALADRLDLVAAINGKYTAYDDDTYDQSSIGLQVGPKFYLPRGQIGFYGTLEKFWYSHDELYESYGARFQGTHKLGKSRVMFFDAFYKWLEFEANKAYDGAKWGGNVSVDHYLNSQSFFRILGGGERYSPDIKHSAYTSLLGGVGYYHELGWGLSIYAQGKYIHKRFDAPFPSKLVDRLDKELNGLIQITKRDWAIMGFAPQLVYEYTRNISNVEFYDYDAHNVNVIFTKNF